MSIVPVASNKKAPALAGAFLLESVLSALYVLGAWAFLALDDIKVDHIANFKFIKHHTLQIFGMEE